MHNATRTRDQKGQPRNTTRETKLHNATRASDPKGRARETKLAAKAAAEQAAKAPPGGLLALATNTIGRILG